jgi:hypothetical protein
MQQKPTTIKEIWQKYSRNIQTEPDELNLDNLIKSTISLNEKMGRRQVMKAHSGPPCKIRCKCSHPQRYHVSPDKNTPDWSGHCIYCFCKEFRPRSEKEKKKWV